MAKLCRNCKFYKISLSLEPCKSCLNDNWAINSRPNWKAVGQNEDVLLTARLELAENVCYALIGQQEHNTAKHRMAVDAALAVWKREAVKGD